MFFCRPAIIFYAYYIYEQVKNYTYYLSNDRCHQNTCSQDIHFTFLLRGQNIM